MRLTDTNPYIRAVLAVALAALLALALAAALAFAEPATVQETSSQDVAHGWMNESAGVMPYTEEAPAEAAAKASAAKALKSPPFGLVRNADHGYAAPAKAIATMRRVARAHPVVVGHELLLANDANAAAVFVNNGGTVKLLEKGNLQLLARRAQGVSDQNDRQAAEIAREAVALHAALDPGSPFAGMHSSVTAHAVGFALPDGTHVVARVGVDGDVSFPDW